ncbi:hypothetical protein BD770DRAFT_120468 [Pilaira anomala]|nr:hypothetical protein BD770DRAFT_120468 [Pilaira anomala]
MLKVRFFNSVLRSNIILILLDLGPPEITVCYVCRPVVESLFELGYLAASPSEPRTAVHFSVLRRFLDLRDTMLVSGQEMAKFHNSQTKLEVQCESLSISLCQI